MVIDPFITAHRVNENENVEIEAVVERPEGSPRRPLRDHIVHHSRKGGNGSSGERSVDDARGASSLIAAAGASGSRTQ